MSDPSAPATAPSLRFAPLSDFEQISDEVWRAAVESSPATKPFDRKMLPRTLEGILFSALASDQAPPQNAVASLLNASRLAGWRVSADYSAHHLQDLTADLTQGGLDGAWLSLFPNQLPHLPEILPKLPQSLAVTLALPPSTCASFASLETLANAVASAPSNLSWAIDIPGALAVSGHLPATPDALLLTLAGALQNPSLALPARVIHIDTTPYHNAGADSSTELALALSTAAWTVDNLTAAGVPLARACQSLSFGFAVDSDFFLQISKLRAARLLWSRITAALGLTSPAAQMWQVASTSYKTLSRFDPWCNVLRATLQTAAAVLGGADEVRVTPFDALLKSRSAWGRRIARNTQLVLRDESKLHALLDPTSGSGQTESMTASLCEFAWSRFQEIERFGGLIQHFVSGDLFSRIAQSATKRAASLAKRLPPSSASAIFLLSPNTPSPTTTFFFLFFFFCPPAILRNYHPSPR